MIDPHKSDSDFEGAEVSIDTCITHLRTLQERTEKYDKAFPYSSQETQEILASFDLFMFEKIIEKLLILKELFD